MARNKKRKTECNACYKCRGTHAKKCKRKHQTFNGVSKTSKPKSTHQKATQLPDGLNLVEGVSFTVAPYGCEFCEQRFATARSRKEHQAKCTAKKEEPRIVSDTSDHNPNTRDEPDILEVGRFKGFSPIVKTLDDAVQEELKALTKENIKVMDAGAGTGLVGVELHKFGFTTIDALDISPGMLEEAKKKNVYRKFICAALGDQRILEIETGEYDVLICVGVFAIAHVPPMAIMELIRMVKAGGLICCSVRNDELEEYYGKMMELEAAGHWKLVKERKAPYYERDDLPTECTAFVYKVLKH